MEYKCEFCGKKFKDIIHWQNHHCKKEIKHDMAKKKSHKVDYITRAKGDLQYMQYASPFIRCDKCKEKLGLMYMIRHALFKKRGCIYVVPCKTCGFLNERTKGGMAVEFDKRWE